MIEFSVCKIISNLRLLKFAPKIFSKSITCFKKKLNFVNSSVFTAPISENSLYIIIICSDNLSSDTDNFSTSSLNRLYFSVKTLSANSKSRSSFVL